MSSSNENFDVNEIKICYQILELNAGASWEEVKQAYRELALVWHPDRFSDNPKLQYKAQEKLKIINQAYEMLKAYYRQRAASTSSKTASQTPPPPPPPPPKKESTNQKTYQPNSYNYTSPNQKTVKDLKLSLNLIEIYKKTWSTLTRSNYFATVSILIPQFLLAIALNLMIDYTQSSGFQSLNDVLVYLLLLLGYIFTWLSGQGAVTFYIWKKLKNKSITITEALTESVNRFFPILGATILYWIVIIIGLIFLIVPGIYLAHSLIFYLQTIVIEKCSVTQSFKRSWQIVKGHRGIIFWNICFISASTSVANKFTWSDYVAVSLFGQLLYLFTLPYTIAYVTVMYTKIVEFKESR
jgi:hypothetical protein